MLCHFPVYSTSSTSSPSTYYYYYYFSATSLELLPVHVELLDLEDVLEQDALFH